MSIENLVFSAGGGFLFGAVAGYALKKVIKIAAVLIGLFVIGLSYLSYKGWIGVKWIEMENATKTTLTNVAQQAVHAVNNTASQFAMHSTTLEVTALPVAAAFGFMPGLLSEVNSQYSQIKDVNTIFSKVSLLDNEKKREIIHSLCNSFLAENDKLKPIKYISSEIMKSEDIEGLLVPESLRL